MEVIKEVLIIEANGINTSCFIVENLPKNLVYHKVKKLMPLDEYSERLVPAFTVDDQGKKHATGELEEALLPGIELDGAGSGGLIFEGATDESKQRLKAIDKHIEDTIKDPALRRPRVPYAQQPGSLTSGPKPYHTIIRVHLPEPVSPPVVPTTEQARTVPETKPKRVLTEEQKAKLRFNLAKAREKKNAQKDAPPQV